MAVAKDYPVMLDLRGACCLVVGGGQVASRKIGGLLAAAAEVVVISPQLGAAIRDWQHDGKLTVYERCYEAGDLQLLKSTPVKLVFAATDCHDVNRMVAEEARACGVLVSSASEPEKGSFRLPAVLRRGDLTISVSTGGASPMLTQKIRDELAQQYGEEYETLVAFFAQVRRHVLNTVADERERRRYFARFMEMDTAELLQAIREQRFEIDYSE